MIRRWKSFISCVSVTLVLSLVFMSFLIQVVRSNFVLDQSIYFRIASLARLSLTSIRIPCQTHPWQQDWEPQCIASHWVCGSPKMMTRVAGDESLSTDCCQVRIRYLISTILQSNLIFAEPLFAGAADKIALTLARPVKDNDLLAARCELSTGISYPFPTFQFPWIDIIAITGLMAIKRACELEFRRAVMIH